MEKLTKDDVLWIFAVKDGRIKEHYERNYGVYDGEPRDSTLYSITRSIVDKTNAWQRVIFNIEMNKIVIQIIEQTRIKKETGVFLYLNEINLGFEQWMWRGMSSFFTQIDRDWLYEHAPKEWEEWVDEEREFVYNKLGMTNKFHNGNVVNYKGLPYVISDINYYDKAGNKMDYSDVKDNGCASFDYNIDTIESYSDFSKRKWEKEIIKNIKEEDLIFVKENYWKV